MNVLEVILQSGSMSAVEGPAPLTLVLNPSALDTSGGPITKLEYNFDDGLPSTIVRRKINVDTPAASAYPYQNDLGDPRNIIVERNLFPSVSSNPQIYNVTINVTQAINFTPTVLSLAVYVFKIDAIDNVDQGYFDDIHLVGTRVYGTDRTKLMIFETSNPRYLTCTTYTF